MVLLFRGSTQAWPYTTWDVWGRAWNTTWSWTWHGCANSPARSTSCKAPSETRLVSISWRVRKPRQRVSNADRKVFANPESFCNKLIICWRISGYFGKCPDTIQNIQIICKVGMNWKFSIWCKKCPDNLKNVSGYSKKSLDNVKMYLENLEGSGWS